MNRIEGLQDVHGDWVWDLDETKIMVSNYFKDLCTDDGPAYIPSLMPSNRFPTLNHDEMNKLCNPYLGNEVKAAVFDIGAYKAPGPDGFLQKSVMGESLISLALKVLSGCDFPKN